MKPLKVYACYNTDLNTRINSSSGAVFSLLAEYVLSEQGIVYGVSMSEDCYSAEFIRVTDRETLAKLRGSKYLQAKVGNTYRLIQEDLLRDKLVLFTGTGCQVNGLKSFLGKDFDNLLCVDVICHGVPSPELWRKYAKHQEQKHGGKLKSINFRCKDVSWTNFGMKEKLNDLPDGVEKKLFVSKDKDPYMQMFLRDYCLRPSCYECMAKAEKKADITIADFWGIDKVAPDMNDGMGTSLVLIRTEKGETIFKDTCASMKVKEVSYEDGVKSNPSEYRSCVRPMQRETFFSDMNEMTFEKLEKKYAGPIKYSAKMRIKRKIKAVIKKLLEFSGGGGVKQSEYSLCFVFDCEEKMI